MRTMDAVRRSGVGIGPDRTVQDAAEIMDHTVDDLLVDLADLARPVTAEVLSAHRDSPVPATA